ncbi:MAG: 6,7-dimethyl-8-ribityllumazine synthase [bacterium]|nr:6,7-dimethyl-8-ribityllumazine synthase [bacterium]
MRTNNFKEINGEDFKIGIIRARFNEDITGGLLSGAMETLKKAGVKEENITVVEVPGSLEIPTIAAKLIEKGGYDALITLGCIIKGETKHDEHIALALFPNLARLSMESKVPITMGILTVLNREQALVRSGTTDMNRGHESANTALEMIVSLREIS